MRRVLTERYHPIITTIRTMPKPVLAAVNGPAVGIGLSLALASDLVVAAESAYLLLAFVNIGLVPDGGSSLFVPTRVGFARAAEMAMLGERDPAPRRPCDWGLVNRVVPDDAFAGEVAALRDRLAAGPTRSYAGSQAPAQPLAVRAAWTSSSSSRRTSSRRWRARRTSPRGSRPSCEKRPPAFGGV